LSDFVLLPEEEERFFSKRTGVAFVRESFPLFGFWARENPLVLQSGAASHTYFIFLVNA